MSHKDAPPETDVQRAAREWWTARYAPRGITVGWGRGKDGRFPSQFARDAEAAWQAQHDAAALPFAALHSELVRRWPGVDLLVDTPQSREAKAYADGWYAAQVARVILPTPAPGKEPPAVDEFEAGWRAAADWANRPDLISDIGSPAYLKDKFKLKCRAAPGKVDRL